jgi:hypothetical protein
MSERRSRYVRQAVKGILDELTGTGEGGRNNALNTAALSLGRFVATGDVDRSGAEAALWRWAEASGLGKNETKKTIASGLNSGERCPADLPDFGDEGPARRLSSFAHPAPGPVASAIPAPPERLTGSLQAIWEVVQSVGGKSQWLLDWATSRGLAAGDVMTFDGVDRRSMGCLFLDVAGLFADDVELLTDLGWLGKGGKLWAGCEHPGALIPLWSPAWLDAPVGFRWMPVPGSWHAENQKRWAMPGGDLWRKVPLWRPSAYPSDTVVIVEGEPDYWSLWRCLHWEGVDCIGLPGAQWASHWDSLLAGRKKAIVAVHDDEAGAKVTAKIAAACKRQDVAVAVFKPSDGDWNDELMRGAHASDLARKIIGVL